ncbi:MAG: phosphoglucosamine mutase [Acidobacteria bacterium RIFCSPLOWO2_02_FULL_65_29]|nr:MAG: phosphoglucosamine mutase [Acidobacteria bacterium RIFCSPLOWO2_02_FULL_65_29]
MTPRLFGTDGVRGRAGVHPLDPQTIRRLGAALVRAQPRTATPRMLVGRDTRESGSWIEAALAEGASSEGAAVTSAGVVPTPAVAYLTRTQAFDAGVVISASHNPFEDNGIKVFSGGGEKFSERLERQIEAIVADRGWAVAPPAPERIGSADLVGAYLDHLRAVFPEAARLRGFRLAVDCANGATAPVATTLFDSLGFDTVTIGNRPDGRNINLGCGSTHPELLAQRVVERGCAAGVAFDGDGDRAIFVDHRGQVVNGDAVLLMCGRQLQREGRLARATVVATVMSNLGLELALRESGIELVRTKVGDKYVMEEILARGLSLGGEQSGHIIFSDYLFTGDGLCTALNVLRTIALTSRSLAELAGDLVTYPQVLLNVGVREQVDLQSVEPVADAIARVEARLAGRGRLLVRYSGTEPLLRVMLEGQDEREIRAWAQEIVEAVKSHLS